LQRLSPHGSQHFVSPGHSLDDFGRSKIYIIDHNPSWKENQRQKRESFWIRELQTLQKGLSLFMKAMRKCNVETYQLAKDQALVKKLKKQKT
jgi:hypothetical protein